MQANPAAFAGAFAGCNIRTQVLAGPGQLVGASPFGAAIGRFAWADLTTGTVANARTAADQRIGFVLAQRGTWQRIYHDATAKAWFIRPGLEVTLAAGGEFWCHFAGGAQAGQRVYASPTDGTATVVPSVGYEATPWVVQIGCDPGSLAVISTYRGPNT